ncbi:ABC transporter ATP-binding protein, partial [Candidatus Roizmanbacteria bacterium]|nr:ABC transporter ATP-binding protein [Candidatus Roizmanbacteria bacterium]
MADTILEVKHLVKEFNSFRAVDDVSFVIPQGKVIGFLGPNGAGKTTTIHILLGIMLPTAGSITYFGKNLREHRQEILDRINYTSAYASMQWRLTVVENLLVFAKLYRIKKPQQKIENLAEQLNATDLLYRPHGSLSAGQKSRVNLVKSLLNDPELVLMDEPTASLDPDIADRILTVIERMKKERGLTLLYTSHNMDEVARICDDVIILDHGRIVAHDTPLELTKRIPNAKLILTFQGDKHAIGTYLVEHDHQFHFINDYMVDIDIEEKYI